MSCLRRLVTVCLPQDRQSKKVIEIGSRHGGLYILNQFKDQFVAATDPDLSSYWLSPSSSKFYI